MVERLLVMVNAITPQAIQAIVQKLIQKAKSGDVASAKVPVLSKRSVRLRPSTSTCV